VLAPNSGQLIIQDNSGYGFFDLAAVGQAYQTNHWYFIQVAWGTNGTITGRLYNSDGQTLLNTVQATATDISAGGIAFRAIGHDKYFDTVTVTQNGGAHSVRLGDGGNINQNPPIFGATGPSVSSGAVALATRQVAEMFSLSNGSSVSSTAAVANSIGAVSSSSSSALSNFFIPHAAARSAASLQESGLASGSAQVTEQDQDADPAVLPSGAVEPSDPTLVDEAEELAQLSQRAPREHSGTDAFFTRADLVVREQVPPPAEGSALLRAAEKGSAAAVAAFLLGFSGVSERDMKEDPRRRARF